MTIDIHTYCRVCREPLPVSGLVKQDVTCTHCGHQFEFAGDGPLYLAPPPGVDAEGFVYKMTLDDGRVIGAMPEMPPVAGDGTAPAEADGPEIGDFYYCPGCGRVRRVPEEDRSDKCNCGDVYDSARRTSLPPASPEAAAALAPPIQAFDARREEVIAEIGRQAEQGDGLTEREIVQAYALGMIDVSDRVEEMAVRWGRPPVGRNGAEAPAVPASSSAPVAAAGDNSPWYGIVVGAIICVAAIPVQALVQRWSDIAGVVVFLLIAWLGIDVFYQGVKKWAMPRVAALSLAMLLGIVAIGAGWGVAAGLGLVGGTPDSATSQSARGKGETSAKAKLTTVKQGTTKGESAN